MTADTLRTLVELLAPAAGTALAALVRRWADRRRAGRDGALN